LPPRTLIRRLIERLNEPFRRGVFGRDIRLAHFVVTVGSLAGTMVVTSALGFPFWWIAARLFSADAMGLAAAAISGMQLLGGVAAFGFGTLLVRELPRHPGHERSLIRSGLIAAGAIGVVVGFGFAYGVSAVDDALAPLSATPWEAAIFAVGVSLTALNIVADQSLVGLLRSELQFARNVVFATSKLVLLAIVGWFAGGRTWAGIYAVWSVSALLSLMLVAGVAATTGAIPSASGAAGPSLRRLGPSAAGHFALNLSLQLPTFGMPILVTIVGSPALNASFYVAWLIASAAAMIPGALSSTLYAVGSRAPGALRRQMQLTLGLSAAAAATAAAVLAITGGALLGFFGPAYVDAAPALTIVAVAAVPMVVKNHFQVLLRIRGQLARAAVVCAVGGLLELVAAALGLTLGGLSGLAAGWLAAVVVEASVMAIPVARTALLSDPTKARP
jgi:O-antigen/teichoic acid export membrane protein